MSIGQVGIFNIFSFPNGPSDAGQDRVFLAGWAVPFSNISRDRTKTALVLTANGRAPGRAGQGSQ